MSIWWSIIIVYWIILRWCHCFEAFFKLSKTAGFVPTDVNLRSGLRWVTLLNGSIRICRYIRWFIFLTHRRLWLPMVRLFLSIAQEIMHASFHITHATFRMQRLSIINHIIRISIRINIIISICCVDTVWICLIILFLFVFSLDIMIIFMLIKAVISRLSRYIGVVTQIGCCTGTHDILLLLLAHLLHNGLFSVVHNGFEQCDGASRRFRGYLIRGNPAQNSAYILKFVQFGQKYCKCIQFLVRGVVEPRTDWHCIFRLQTEGDGWVVHDYYVRQVAPHARHVFHLTTILVHACFPEQPVFA